jgi:hypothetical protein
LLGGDKDRRKKRKKKIKMKGNIEENVDGR